MFVKYTPKHPHIKVIPIVNGDGLSVASESVTLNPGTNEVSDEKWEKIKASLADEISAGTVKPFSVGTKKAGNTVKAKTLREVPVSTAATIIANCSNKETLRAWFNDSLSDELALLVVKRMRQLNIDLDSISGDGTELSDDDIIDESGDSEPVGSDGSDEGEKAEEEDVGKKAANSYDGMSYAELQAVAKVKGITPSQKKEALIAALKGETVSAGGNSGDGSDEGGDNIPDFDDPNTKVS